MFNPQGTLTAVHFADTPNGLPRFCTAGCAETVYMSGSTDTLFIAKFQPDGSIATEPDLALGFTLDPSLEFGDFKLRQGVQFHNGWGEMTAKDVAFSYNDANSVTNPESIHGQAGDFAPLILSMEPLDDYTIRLNYRNYDSRGILHRFSAFWQTAAIVSSAVFESRGVEGMQDDYTGVGAFVIDEWVDDKGFQMHAFEDYWGTPEGLGPFVENFRILEIKEAASRRAMLETGEAQIADVPLKDFPELIQSGFAAQKDAGFNTIDNFSMTGNYWEQFSALSGAPLERDRDTSKPWVGNPFENGEEFDETTPSMVSSMKVRNALAWAIDRQALLDSVLGGLGFVNSQPYLSENDPNYKVEWNWGKDYELARSLMAEAGYADGFEMDFHLRDQAVWHETGEALAATWLSELKVKSNLIKAAYSTYRPGLVARTTNTPAFAVCGDENKANFPFDWAHGFVVSSMSAGGYGVGQEIPYASKSYLGMAGEPDKAKREALASEFYTNNKKFANCIGIFERPVWVLYDPDKVIAWDMRPMANGNLSAMNNFRTIKLAN
ncbi:MAG: ABC transporter substrate-binding protein [Chloroflexi bacterium]|nr:ABC transporter substrate-binding protein [Chloroflexota bacterium]